MRKRPPHIVVTTPESLYILLGSESGRAMLKTTRTVIVDEIHAVGTSKRGSHLALSLERLSSLCGGRPAADRAIGHAEADRGGRKFLGGCRFADSELPLIVDSGHFRERDLQLEVPPSPLEAVMSAEVWDQVYDRIAELIESHRTTLIFVNTRRMAERVTRKLSDRLGEKCVCCASRQPRQGEAARRRTASEDRRALGDGGDILARARHRYRRS